MNIDNELKLAREAAESAYSAERSEYWAACSAAYSAYWAAYSEEYSADWARSAAESAAYLAASSEVDRAAEKEWQVEQIRAALKDNE